VADALFPVCSYDYGREYWRAFGLVLAWPLFFWNAMNGQPLTAWLVISGVQTFVLIPLIVWRYHLVDIFLAGIVGVGVNVWFSGRAWCRFACPLAALMHVYARLGRFRIFAEKKKKKKKKKKCISCNVCTTVCHQGIDVMSFANRGEPMADPECVRCSACDQSCPTGVLSFGRLGEAGPILDRVLASPVQLRQGRLHLRVLG